MVLWFDRVLLNHIERQENAEAQLILKEADDPFNLVDSSGNTLLHYAAKCGNVEMTEYLIESGSSVDAQNKNGQTPLILAMYYVDSVSIPEVLLDANADINMCDKDGISSLQLAIHEFHNYRLWRRFLKRIEVEYSFDYEKITDMLISRGCDLADAMYFGCAEVTERMLKRENVPTKFHADGQTALHNAVIYMHLQNIKLLIEHGVDLNALCTEGATPIAYFGVHHGDENLMLEMLKTLMDAGAKMFTSYENNGQIMQVENILNYCSKEMVRLLMTYDVDLNAKDAWGRTVLHALALNNTPGILDELKSKDIDVDARTENGITPLWFAVCNPSSVKFLLDRGADVNASNNYGMLPLMKLFIVGEDKQTHLESVELLLLYGADIETIYKDATTIFDAAFQNHTLALIEPILAHVAMLQANEKPISTLVSERIRAHEMLQKRLDFYAQQMEEMKSVTVCQSITLYNLLTDSDDKIVAYMRNKDLVLKLSRLSNKCGLTSYYHKYLRKRITKAMQVAKLKEGAATVLCKMTGLCFDANSVIADKIINYLNFEDLQELHYVYN